jgi:Rad3-related DNA helicase
VKIFLHTPKVLLRDLIEKFKAYSKPAILISPSMCEGIDLPDDESRYQIFVKAPFYSLADKRIEYISKEYPNLYQKLALFRVIQGSGRSVRSETDYSVTYFIDTHLGKLFLSEGNIWKNEFEIIQ